MNYQHMTPSEIETRLYAEGNNSDLLLRFVQDSEEADIAIEEAQKEADEIENELDRVKIDLENNENECRQALEQVDQAIELLDAGETKDTKAMLENVADILACICE